MLPVRWTPLAQDSFRSFLSLQTWWDPLWAALGVATPQVATARNAAGCRTSSWPGTVQAGDWYQMLSMVEPHRLLTKATMLLCVRSNTFSFFFFLWLRIQVLLVTFICIPEPFARSAPQKYHATMIHHAKSPAESPPCGWRAPPSAHKPKCLGPWTHNGLELMLGVGWLIKSVLVNTKRIKKKTCDCDEVFLLCTFGIPPNLAVQPASEWTRTLRVMKLTPVFQTFFLYLFVPTWLFKNNNKNRCFVW